MNTTCQNCGEKFSPKHALDYYCSDECHFDYLKYARKVESERSENGETMDSRRN